ncbi:MAG: hypothetical protein N0A16_08960 [Blastocatellia bacterium]|nr:hypothetical protein [Blastocatellia bacterium]MCS7157844.1 hypothetical protein [Blastocatellia bacterium]MCX7753419.1 hypothetical protein [Blastocatellia bacterium]MDW8168078.1 hypothetical protein [Acidobacteriota bacterium]MDW8257673.1 hypothetical protein [Acidobacteriota bacterium]
MNKSRAHQRPRAYTVARVLLVVNLLWEVPSTDAQSWYGPGMRRIEPLARYEVKVEDHVFVLYPLAVTLDMERQETTVWLYVGSERDRGKVRYFCPRGVLLRDGVSERRFALSRLEGLSIVRRKGECLEFRAQGPDLDAQARARFEAVGEQRWRGDEKPWPSPAQVGLVFFGLPSPRATYLAVQLPFGEEILIATRDLR